MKHADEALIAEVVATGSQRAFALLVDAHQAPVRRFLLRMTGGDAMLADDLAQETFIRAWQHLRDFHGTAAFETWLLRIAYRIFLDEKRSSRTTASLDDMSAGTPLAATLAERSSESSQQTMRYDIDRAMATLSEAERTCVTLQCIEGYSIHDIAGITALNENTVKSHLARGKRVLAMYLRKNGY